MPKISDLIAVKEVVKQNKDSKSFVTFEITLPEKELSQAEVLVDVKILDPLARHLKKAVFEYLSQKQTIVQELKEFGRLQRQQRKTEKKSKTGKFKPLAQETNPPEQSAPSVQPPTPISLQKVTPEAQSKGKQLITRKRTGLKTKVVGSTGTGKSKGRDKTHAT